jgi:hypothetical protein
MMVLRPWDLLQVRVSAVTKGLLMFYLQNAVLSVAIYPSHNSHYLGCCISTIPS